jgi:hypothetical protein
VFEHTPEPSTGATGQARQAENAKKGNALNKCIRISTIYWNHNAFCGHPFGKLHGMME